MCHDIHEFRRNGFKRHGLTLELSKNAVYAGQSFFGMITFNHCENDNRPTLYETLFNTEHGFHHAWSTRLRPKSFPRDRLQQASPPTDRTTRRRLFPRDTTTQAEFEKTTRGRMAVCQSTIFEL